MNFISKINCIKFVSFLLLYVLLSARAFSITAVVKPHYLPIDCFYYGGTIVVTGQANVNEEIIIKITSKDKTSYLRKKKRVDNLWLNSGELAFHFAPDVYLLYSTKNISDLLNEKERFKYCIGYTALRKHIKIQAIKDKDTTNCDQRCRFFNEFIKLQKDKYNYGIFDNIIKTNIKDDKKYFKLTINWHYQAPPTDYKINIYGIKNKSVQDCQQLNLKSEKVGFLKIITNMANNNSAIYSVLSIILVIFFSFFVSMIFNIEKRCKK